MYVGRIIKETNEVREVPIDLSRWLDFGEFVGRVNILPVALTTFNSAVLNTSTGTFRLIEDLSVPPPLVSPPPPDITPLAISQVSSDGMRVRMLLASGTPGLAYTASVLAVSNSSPRQIELDVLVIVVASFNILQPSGPPPMTQVVSGNTVLPIGFSGLVIVQNTGGGSITITLPQNPTVGQTVRGVDDTGNAGVNSIHWQSADGSPIVNQVIFDFTDNFQSATFTWTGSRWSL
jgi:hypothetical protein